ncbi:DUF3098 domain-containing protein [Porphyromonadaceae bacterium W3.11]|nr:DUF3098 domain-containing protein [Porphyromonadaceae bacterium W3.11]
MKDNNKGVVHKTYGFTLKNLIILLLSLVVIVIGYILMGGGKSEDGVSFNPEVFNTMRTSVAPIILTIGYLGVLVAVIWKDKSNKSDN